MSDSEIKVGSVFANFKLVEKAIHRYENQTGYKYKIFRSQMISSENKKHSGFDKKNQIYAEYILECSSVPSRHKRKKDINGNPSQSVCPAKISIYAIKKPIGLRVTTLIDKHTCEKQLLSNTDEEGVRKVPIVSAEKSVKVENAVTEPENLKKSEDEKTKMDTLPNTDTEIFGKAEDLVIGLNDEKIHNEMAKIDELPDVEEFITGNDLVVELMDEESQVKDKAKRIDELPVMNASVYDDSVIKLKDEKKCSDSIISEEPKQMNKDEKGKVLKETFKVIVTKMLKLNDENFLKKLKDLENFGREIENDKNDLPIEAVKRNRTASKGRPTGKSQSVIGLKKRGNIRNQIQRKKVDGAVKFIDLTKEQKKKKLLQWLLPNFEGHLLQLCDIESIKHFKESLFDNAVDISLIEDLCANKKVSAHFHEKFLSAKKKFENSVDTNFTCGICANEIDDDKEESVFCDACLLWFHSTCADFCKTQYKDDDPWFCNNC